MFEGGQAGEWRAKVSNAGVMLASVAPVTEFLTKAGQGQLATQCEHTEGKLFILSLLRSGHCILKNVKAVYVLYD